MLTRRDEFFLGALIGGVIGAAAALIYAPMSGPALRKQITGGINQLNGSSPKNPPLRKRKPPVKKKTSPSDVHQPISSTDKGNTDGK